MANTKELPAVLMQANSFSRKEFINAMMDCYSMSKTQSDYDLQKRIKAGSLVRIGWGQYALSKEKMIYSHVYSEEALQIASTITKQYDNLNFQIFELEQLNAFMNHLVAHNTIFVSVENDLIDYVFDTLWKTYPGRVLLKPSTDEYYRYLQDNEIIVNRLPSETPKGYGPPWQSKLEKILVDVSVDKIVSEIVPNGEKQVIFENAFHDYLIDVNMMIHYANRKRAKKKIVQVLKEHGRMA